MLALLGSGEYLPPVEPIDRALLATLNAPRVACLPTAAGRESAQRVAYWSELGVAHFTRLGAAAESVPVLDQRSAEDSTLAERVRAANLIYLSGGDPNYLYQVLAGSRTWKAIEAVLAEGGVLAGCSAGAMVMGEHVFGFPGWKAGLGLLPGVAILPHYDEIGPFWVKAIRQVTNRKKLLIGIEGSTALVVDGSCWSVRGLGGVTVMGPKGQRRYADGEMIGVDDRRSIYPS